MKKWIAILMLHFCWMATEAQAISLSLEEAEKLALSPLNAIQSHKLRKFDFIHKEIKGRKLPQIGLSQQVDAHQQTSKIYNSLSLEQQIYDPEYKYQLEKSRLEKDILGLELQEGVSELLFEVRNLYCNTIYHQRLVKSCQNMVRLVENELDHYEQHLIVGSLSSFEFNQMKQLLYQAKSELFNYQTELLLELYKLLSLLGLPLNAEVELTSRLDIESIHPITFEEWEAMAFDNRADLKKGAIISQIAQETCKNEKEWFVPTVNFYANAGHLYGEDIHSTWDLGINLNWSIFDGYQKRSRLNQAKEDQQVALIEQELASRRTSMEVKCRLLKLNRALQNYSMAIEERKLAEELLSMASHKQEIKLIDFIEYKEALKTFIEAQHRVEGAIKAAYMAYYSLIGYVS